MEWASWYSGIFAESDQACVVVLDVETYVRLLHARLDVKGRGKGLWNVLPMLDLWHVLFYLSQSFVENFAPLIGLFNQHVFEECPSLYFDKCSHMQWLLSVLVLAYKNSGVKFHQGVQKYLQKPLPGGAPVGPALDFATYLYGVFDISLPLIFGAWWLYREGQNKKLMAVLNQLVPLLEYQRHPSYSACLAFHLSLLHSNGGGCGTWMSDSSGKLGSAEVGELAFKFLKLRLQPYAIKGEMPTISKVLFSLLPAWEASQLWHDLLGLHPRKVHRQEVEWGGVWVGRAMLFVKKVHGQMMEGMVPEGRWPQRGGFLQKSVRGAVLKRLVTRTTSFVHGELPWMEGQDWGHQDVEDGVHAIFGDDVHEQLKCKGKQHMPGWKKAVQYQLSHIDMKELFPAPPKVRVFNGKGDIPWVAASAYVYPPVEPPKRQRKGAIPDTEAPRLSDSESEGDEEESTDEDEPLAKKLRKWQRGTD